MTLIPLSATKCNVGADEAALGPGTALRSGLKAVTAAGTPERLVSGSLPARWVLVGPKVADDGTAVNTKCVLIGHANKPVFRLGPSHPGVVLSIADAYEIWVDALVNGEGVQWLALV